MESPNKTQTPDSVPPRKSREIDLLGALGKVWQEKKLLAAFVILFGIIGVVVALTKQKVYTASVYLAPEAASMGMSQGLGDLAGMVGLDLKGKNGSVDAIYPDIYPDIFASSDFIIQLFNVPVRLDKTGQVKTYYDHLIQDYKTPFWNKPKDWVMSLFKKKPGKEPKGVNPFHLTQQQNDVCDMVRHVIGCQMNKTTNIINISVSDIDPVVAATMADTLQRRLQAYITLYRTQKARNDLAYARKLREEAKTRYEQAQRVYAGFADANTDVLLESFRTKRSMLEDQMQTRYNRLNETDQQVQLALARVQERTPAFTIIQSASVPLRASSTPRSMMVLGYMLFGAFLDVVWVLFARPAFRRFRKG